MRRMMLLFCLMGGPSGYGEEPTALQIDGRSYGAERDLLGPIGGGYGYQRILATGDFVVRSLDELLDALARAQSDQVVFVPGDVEIDCTARVYIEQLVLRVPAGVTLASDRGHDHSPGALIYCDALKTPGLIRAEGPGVRVTGLRIRGPNAKRYLDHHRRAYAEGRGPAYFYKFPTSNGIVTESAALEVDNCEISAFSHAGVHLRAGDRHHVHHCYIHHCQYAGLGYGVCHNQAHSLIERNRFDANRHSIAGTGRPGRRGANPSADDAADALAPAPKTSGPSATRPAEPIGCGYEARHNLEMGISLSHCFDMHGGRDREDGTDIAGRYILIHHNTFRAPETPVVIRGVPQDVCEVYSNWLPRHQSPQQAVRGHDRTQVRDNAYGLPATVR